MSIQFGMKPLTRQLLSLQPHFLGIFLTSFSQLSYVYCPRASPLKQAIFACWSDAAANIY